MGNFGSANLVLPEVHHHLIVEYIAKHRPIAAEGCEEYVFLTPQGRQVAHISDDLRALSKDFPTSIGTISVTATEMRKLTATNVAAEGTEDLVRKVAAHMTHGEDTAKKYYRHIQGVAESVNAYEVTAVGVGLKRRAADEGDNKDDDKDDAKENYLPKLKKRVKWLPEETEEIKNYFDWTKGTPSLEQCGSFLVAKRDENSHLFQGRGPKEIQDKCRTIKKKQCNN